MSEIPEDIRRAARAIAGDAVELHLVSEIEELASQIASAIMAERERCAQIAESDNHFPAEGEWIASLIRTPSTGEEQ